MESISFPSPLATTHLLILEALTNQLVGVTEKVLAQGVGLFECTENPWRKRLAIPFDNRTEDRFEIILLCGLDEPIQEIPTANARFRLELTPCVGRIPHLKCAGVGGVCLKKMLELFHLERSPPNEHRIRFGL